MRRNGSERSRWIVAVSLVAVLALLAMGCGGNGNGEGGDDGEETALEGVNLLAQYCPLEVIIGESGNEQYGDPVEDAWDTSEVIDKPLGEAQQLAEANGCYVQVSLQDGQGLPVQMGLHPNRVLVWTEDNVVTNVEQVG